MAPVIDGLLEHGSCPLRFLALLARDSARRLGPRAVERGGAGRTEPVRGAEPESVNAAASVGSGSPRGLRPGGAGRTRSTPGSSSSSRARGPRSLSIDVTFFRTSVFARGERGLRAEEASRRSEGGTAGEHPSRGTGRPGLPSARRASRPRGRPPRATDGRRGAGRASSAAPGRPYSRGTEATVDGEGKIWSYKERPPIPP